MKYSFGVIQVELKFFKSFTKVHFRGTNEGEDVLSYPGFLKTKLKRVLDGKKYNIRVAKRTLKTMQEELPKIIKVIQENKKCNKVKVSGFSLGGGFAGLFTILTLLVFDSIELDLIKSPRFANKAFWNYLTNHPVVKSIKWTIMGNDIVPKVPPRWLGYSDPIGEKRVIEVKDYKNIWEWFKSPIADHIKSIAPYITFK